MIRSKTTTRSVTPRSRLLLIRSWTLPSLSCQKASVRLKHLMSPPEKLFQMLALTMSSQKKWASIRIMKWDSTQTEPLHVSRAIKGPREVSQTAARPASRSLAWWQLQACRRIQIDHLICAAIIYQKCNWKVKLRRIQEILRNWVRAKSSRSKSSKAMIPWMGNPMTKGPSLNS